MADGVTVEVRGADRLARTARAAAGDLADLTAANRAAVEGIRDAARPPRRTGRLAASIVVMDVGPHEATVGSSLVYAPVIESGWPAHGIEARRFMASAAEARWTATVDIYADAVDDALAQVKGA